MLIAPDVSPANEHRLRSPLTLDYLKNISRLSSSKHSEPQNGAKTLTELSRNQKGSNRAEQAVFIYYFWGG